MLSRSEELEAMKRIDLCQYAASRGFILDRKSSSRSSFVMRHTNGDKLIVGKTSSGQYIYFNAKGNDNGTIIDFVQAWDHASLGEVRKTLRPWLNGTPISLQQLPPLPIKLEPSEHDAARVMAAWMNTKPIYKTHPYLEYERKIPRELLMSPLLHDRIRIDARNNAVFPHFNQSGLCGFEQKNRGWTGFSPGGVKGLACTHPQEHDRMMVVCETVIDMLSYAALHGLNGKRLFSTAGQISPLQVECLRSAVSNMPDDATVVLAFDNDDGGYQLTEKVREALSDCDREIITHFPAQVGSDWNDVLQNSVTPQFRNSVSP